MTPLDHWRRRAQTFAVNGNNISYWELGAADPEKPVLLLIHGFPTSSWDWTAIHENLQERFKPVALDMLGFGLSDKPRSASYTIALQADLQEALLARLNISDAHLLVHDYGNTVAQELLARQNEKTLSFKIHSICFLNGGLFPEQHRPLLIQKIGLTPAGPLLGLAMTKKRFRDSLDKVFGPTTKADDDEIEAHWSLLKENAGQLVLHKLLRYIPERKANRQRWVGALSNASAPLGLIDGGADPVSGSHLYHYFRKLLPEAYAVMFDEIGHYPHTEAPERVVDAFIKFHDDPPSKTTGRGHIRTGEQ